uniref:Cytokinin dehydrogenase n=1 Tax=Rhizophora mucronata TaxID=61149 RepID=A0A2P2JJW2_RHIMU
MLPICSVRPAAVASLDRGLILNSAAVDPSYAVDPTATSARPLPPPSHCRSSLPRRDKKIEPWMWNFPQAFRPQFDFRHMNSVQEIYVWNFCYKKC